MCRYYNFHLDSQGVVYSRTLRAYTVCPMRALCCWVVRCQQFAGSSVCVHCESAIRDDGGCASSTLGVGFQKITHELREGVLEITQPPTGRYFGFVLAVGMTEGRTDGKLRCGESLVTYINRLETKAGTSLHGTSTENNFISGTEKSVLHRSGDL